MGVKDLLAATTQGQGRRFVLPPKTKAAIERDLKEICAAEKAGKPIPSRPQIRAYLQKEYGVAVSRWVLDKWITTVQNGGRI